MKNKLELAVIFGGVSSEHDVSLISATSVLNNLDAEKYNITRIGITKSGEWLLYNGACNNLDKDTWYKTDCIPCVVSPDTKTHGILYTENGKIVQKRLDVIFPVLHGKNGEDGTIQGLFE
ncbi:MAG: hypothetical protein RR902_04710, partial [Oscillospiraceae bacterium]